MKRFLLIAMTLMLLTPSVAAGEPVFRQIAFSKNVPLPVPKSYLFRFTLIDSPDPLSGQMVWSEERRIRLTTNVLRHKLGSVDPYFNPIDPAHFKVQLWVLLERMQKGVWKQLGAPTPLSVVPYALSSASLPPDAVTSSEILNGSVTAADLADGSVLSEILDDDGPGSALDADTVDGSHSDAFAEALHDHDSAYVKEGQAGSITTGMIADGAVTDDKIAVVSSSGKVADTALSSNVSLLDADQTVTGVKTFNPSAGTAPFAVDASKTGLVTNLHAESAQDAATLGGRALGDLDARYGVISKLLMGSFTSATVDSVNAVGECTSIAIGVDGLPIISYYDRTDYDLKVTHCGDAACTADNTTTVVDSVGNVGFDSSITIGADGLPVISYLDNSNLDLKVTHCGSADCSSGNVSYTLDADGDVGRYTSIAIGADGLPVVSYLDNTNRNLKVVHCGDAACSAGNTISTLDSAGWVGEYTSIAIGADGLPIIAYYDFTNANLKAAHCADASCSSADSVAVVDSAGDVGVNASVAVGADGLPVIAYYDATNGDLKVAHCGNVACSSGNSILAVDSGGTVGEWASITIGADNLPVISYNDATNGDLKVAHCGNVACSSGNSSFTIDSAGSVGEWTSITIGVGGSPVISYYDGTGGDLKVARGFMRPLGRR